MDISRIQIVEDMPDAREWLAEIAREVFPHAQVHGAATLAAARPQFERVAPQLVLVDLNLPDGLGHDLIAAWMNVRPRLLSIVTTVYDDDAHLFPALRAGACGYLLKTDPRPTLTAQLHGIVDGHPPLSPSVAQRMMRHFVAAAPPAEPLTERERDVLVLIARGRRTADVAAELAVSINTISTHIKHIYAKLGISTRAEATLAAERMGMLDRAG
ncbi:MAG: LuxR C-terminal-related transcriptional regulator [Gammaproteobacteria bacterium]